MIQTGIFTGYFPYSVNETAERIRSLGFNTVQLDVSFKDIDLSAGQITRQKCRKVRDAFRTYNLPVCCISGYTNLIHPDPVKRTANLTRLKEIITFALELGSPYVISETGTFNRDSDWMHHPANKTDEGYEECLDVIGNITRFAAEHGVTFLVETYVNNVIGTVEETLRLFNDVNHPNLGLLMDPTNYFEDHNIDAMDSTLNHIFDALSNKIVIAHAKDVKRAAQMQGVSMAGIEGTEGHKLRGVGIIELPAPGLGWLNYNLYLERLGRDHPNIPVIIEHLDESDVVRAKKFLDAKLMETGR
ncbi:sugar phosphate isomerase/epimerase [Mucilaginibacter hurinus]|uniref:Sugar phosphate isomerase/epimerase n=1 Tax=Mucilaginibacter hurinus TaxID=2201324 RepID=A0A367GU09_9SPHI|nr:sugar phosphate isomerase/epimerase [Mucilaginibacter hurinus]RCH56902.1 sugar phosphate isomerase/epimerase [Mucilaginibacter hurinus]